jgi:hypothetical protein
MFNESILEILLETARTQKAMAEELSELKKKVQRIGVALKCDKDKTIAELKEIEELEKKDIANSKKILVLEKEIEDKNNSIQELEKAVDESYKELYEYTKKYGYEIYNEVLYPSWAIRRFYD